VVEAIATQYAGRLTVGTLNVDEHPTVAQRSGITSILALMFFHDGQVRETVVGAVPKPVLTARVVRRAAWGRTSLMSALASRG